MYINFKMMLKSHFDDILVIILDTADFVTSRLFVYYLVVENDNNDKRVSVISLWSSVIGNILFLPIYRLV